MLHDERPIHFDELADVIKKLYRALDKLNSKMISIEGTEYASIFMKSPPQYNRTAIDFAYSKTRRCADEEANKDIKLALYSFAIEQIIDNQELERNKIDTFCNKNINDCTASENIYMTTDFMGTLAANLNHVASRSLDLCTKYECDILKTLPPLERRKAISEEIKEMVRKENFYSKAHSELLHEYAEHKLQILRYMKEDMDEELNSSELDDKISAEPNFLSVEILTKIRNLISNSDSGWDEAISILESNISKETEEYDILVLIRARISDFKKGCIIDILSSDDQHLIRIRINQSLLELAKRLKTK